MDYLVLVNGSHPLPEGWENDLETVRVTNSVGDGVEMEKRTHAAFLELAADLERDGIRIEPLRDRLKHLVEKRFRGELTQCRGCAIR